MNKTARLALPLFSALTLCVARPSLGRAQYEARPAAEIVPGLSGAAAFAGLAPQTALMPRLAPALLPALAAPAQPFSATVAAAPAASLAVSAFAAAAAEPNGAPAGQAAAAVAPIAPAANGTGLSGEPLARDGGQASAPAHDAAPQPIGRDVVGEVGRHVSDGSTSAMFTGDGRGREDLAPLEAPLSKDPGLDSTLRAALIRLGLNDRVTADRLRRSSDLFAAAIAEQRGVPLPGAESVPTPSAQRDLSTREFFVLNALGVVGSIAAGIFFRHVLLGLLGTYVAAIPLIYGYVAFRRARGDRMNWPGFRFSPRFSWAGRSYPLLDR